MSGCLKMKSKNSKQHMLLPKKKSKRQKSMHEMLHVARECSNRDADSLLTYGEFCLYSTELRRQYSKEIPRPLIMSKISYESKKEKKSEIKYTNETSQKYQVFLGGSCNPTTWRKDIAIPMLNHLQISYYNPQVLHWNEALVEREYQAKQTASVLFFVLDSATRNVASMVEAGYLSGAQPSKLVMVVDNYSAGQTISNEVITQSEYEELTNSINMVQDLVQRQAVPVFHEINHALNCTAKIIRENLTPQDLSLDDQVQPVRNPQVPLGDKLIKIHDAFVNTNSNQLTLTLSEAQVAYKVVTNKELSLEEIKTIVLNKKNLDNEDLNCTELSLQDITLSFEEFCCVVAEFKSPKLERRKLWDAFTHSLITPIQKVLGWNKPQRIGNSAAHDIYLGGGEGCFSTSRWKEEIAIPLLRKSGVSFYNPNQGSGRLLPMEAVPIDLSRVLLFVISKETRGTSAMALAAHYIGLECNVVLCVEMIEGGTEIDGEKLTENAIKDYNRGRTYLSEQANKDRIPVFSNIKEAVVCAIEKCKAAR